MVTAAFFMTITLYSSSFGKTYKIETYLASEISLAKEWLTSEEDKAWENL